uniref:Uncharacterized protein n=1 Tax=Anguilla anguilla TaxID=7936 RepID=A0A0E9PC89_ANGAN
MYSPFPPWKKLGWTDRSSHPLAPHVFFLAH